MNPTYLSKDSDLPFSFNAPQDAQDSHDSHDLNRKTQNNNRFSLPLSREIVNSPLEDYVSAAIEFCAKLREEQSEDEWKSPLFDFARWCKAHQAITDLPSHQAMQTVEAVMYKLAGFPKGIDPWEHFFPLGEYGEPLAGDESRLDFMTSWDSVRHVPFRDVLQLAVKLSKERPLEPAHHRGELYARFISFAGWLQYLRCDLGIYLPTRTVAELLSCNQRTASRLCKLAIRDGLLTMVREHTFRSAGKSEAAEFRFAIERFCELRDEQ